MSSLLGSSAGVARCHTWYPRSAHWLPATLRCAGVFAGIVPGSITLPANVVDSCRQLLALAVAGVEHWQLQQVPATQAPNGDPSDPAPAAASGADPTYSRVLTSVDSSSVPEAAAMLTAAQDTARALLKGLRLDEAMEARMRRVRGWARTAMIAALYTQQLVCCLPDCGVSAPST